MEICERINKLPQEIINHIIPYTYETKPREHIRDIKSFHIHYIIFTNLWLYDYNEVIALNDLIRFCNNNIAPIYEIEPKYQEILTRHVSFKDKTKSQITNFIFYDFHRTMLINPGSKIRFIWGLLTNIERIAFLRTYTSI